MTCDVYRSATVTSCRLRTVEGTAAYRFPSVAVTGSTHSLSAIERRRFLRLLSTVRDGRSTSAGVDVRHCRMRSRSEELRGSFLGSPSSPHASAAAVRQWLVRERMYTCQLKYSGIVRASPCSQDLMPDLGRVFHS